MLTSAMAMFRGQALLRARCAAFARSPSLFQESVVSQPLLSNPSRGFAVRNRRVLEIILMEDNEKLGMKGEVISVRPGYGRNWLIPQKLAVYATPENRELYEVKTVFDGEGEENAGLAREHEFRKYLKEYIAHLENIELFFGRTMLDNGTLQYPVKKDQVAMKLWQHYELLGLTERSVIFPNDAKTLEVGEHVIQIQLGRGWVAPGIGIFAEFERLAADVKVDMKIKIAAKTVLTDAQKESKKDERKAARERKKEEQNEPKDKKKKKK